MCESANIRIDYSNEDGYSLSLTDESADITKGGATAFKTNHAAILGDLIMNRCRDMVSLTSEEVKTEFIKTLEAT